MLEKLKTLCVDDKWLSNSYSSSLGKLLFNNGYFDMKTNKFHYGFNKDIVFSGKINTGCQIHGRTKGIFIKQFEHFWGLLCVDYDNNDSKALYNLTKQTNLIIDEICEAIHVHLPSFFKI